MDANTYNNNNKSIKMDIDDKQLDTQSRMDVDQRGQTMRNNNSSSSLNQTSNQSRMDVDQRGQTRRNSNSSSSLNQTSNQSTNDMEFGFDNADFSDHKLWISLEGSSDKAKILNVSKLLIAKESVWFRNNMVAGPVTEVKLPSDSNINHFVDIIKWIYCSKFDTTGLELLNVMKMAFDFQIVRAMKACVTELTTIMNVETACKILENENKLTETTMNTSDVAFKEFVTLWRHAKTYLRTQFRDFTYERWAQKDFIDLTVDGLRVVLSNTKLRVANENVVFAALRKWVHHDFLSRSHLIEPLLSLIRFSLLHKNYLLDVVRTEADYDYPVNVKKRFGEEIIRAYVYHCKSPVRREHLKEEDVGKRAYTQPPVTTEFLWTVSNISQKTKETSGTIFMGGYYFNLLFQKAHGGYKDGQGDSLSLYLVLDLKETGMGVLTLFYIPIAFEFSFKNKFTKEYNTLKGVYKSHFTSQHKAWGYVDVFGISWENFLLPACRFNENDSFSVKCSITFGYDKPGEE